MLYYRATYINWKFILLFALFSWSIKIAIEIILKKKISEDDFLI